MHSPAMVIITNHIFELHSEAAANRLAKEAKRTGSRSNGRIAAALTSLRSLLSSPADGPMPVPKLKDYPYKS